MGHLSRITRVPLAASAGIAPWPPLPPCLQAKCDSITEITGIDFCNEIKGDLIP